MILLIQLYIFWATNNILINIKRSLHWNLMFIVIKLNLWGEHVKLSATLLIISLFNFLQVSIVNKSIVKSVLYLLQVIVLLMMIRITELSTYIYGCYVQIASIIIFVVILVH